MIEEALFSSQRTDWETPQALFDSLDAEFHFTLDPASTDANAKCKKHFTPREDGLLQSWAGETVFCNPPYGRSLPLWIEKAAKEARKGATVVMLIPARTDTKAFHDHVYNKAEIRFLRGRLKFGLGGVTSDAAPFPSMIVVFRPHERASNG